MRSFLVKSEMRSPNLGTAAIALSNVVLVIFFVVEGINDGEVKGKDPSSPFTFLEKRKISVKYCSGRL